MIKLIQIVYRKMSSTSLLNYARMLLLIRCHDSEIWIDIFQQIDQKEFRLLVKPESLKDVPVPSVDLSLGFVRYCHFFGLKCPLDVISKWISEIKGVPDNLEDILSCITYVHDEKMEACMEKMLLRNASVALKILTILKASSFYEDKLLPFLIGDNDSLRQAAVLAIKGNEDFSFNKLVKLFNGTWYLQ